MKEERIDQQTLLGLVRYNADGLVPCVVQDAGSGEVLMVAYADAEALGATLATGEAHFWSRSRRELWHKGGTSGNVQRVMTVSWTAITTPCCSASPPPARPATRAP